jgi:hypothetical protein
LEFSQELCVNSFVGFFFWMLKFSVNSHHILADRAL